VKAPVLDETILDEGNEGNVVPVETPGFENKGGILFPTSASTGLSDAPILAILAKILAWLILIFGYLSVGAFILSGIQYLLAAGNESLIKTAKTNMTWSIVGVIVGFSGYIIINAVFNALQGTGSAYF
jgi:hypothetical protein